MKSAREKYKTCPVAGNCFLRSVYFGGEIAVGPPSPKRFCTSSLSVSVCNLQCIQVQASASRPFPPGPRCRMMGLDHFLGHRLRCAHALALLSINSIDAGYSTIIVCICFAIFIMFTAIVFFDAWAQKYTLTLVALPYDAPASRIFWGY